MPREAPPALRALFREAWSRGSSSLFDPENPARGQCGVTALVVHDHLGGEILKTPVGKAWHFYNRVGGRVLDLTAEQFVEPITYRNFPSSRAEALGDADETRYRLLAERFTKALEGRWSRPGRRVGRILRPMSGKPYDRAYFEKWYRGDGAVITPAARRRKVAMVLGIAEFLLERPVRSVLDVGCGEAPWQPLVKELRPRASYLGLDPSAYAVSRFGRSRNVKRGSFGELAELGLSGPYDLVVCSDALHYVDDEDVWKGLPYLAALLEGVAFLEVLTTDDEIVGDLEGWHARPASWYRRAFDAAGLLPCGMQCWASPLLSERLVSMERP